MRGSIMRDSIPWGKLENPNAGKKELKKPKNREPLAVISLGKVGQEVLD